MNGNADASSPEDAAGLNPDGQASGRYERLCHALELPPDERTTCDIVEIDFYLRRIEEPIIAGLDEHMRHAVSRKLRLQDVEAGSELFGRGDIGDRMFIVWTGSLQVEVLSGREPGQHRQVKLRYLQPGKVVGEQSLVSADCRRTFRCFAGKPSRLLVLTAEDYKWCMSVGQSSHVHERVRFLETVEHKLLQDSSQADLQVMAGCLKERFYTAHETIIEQGTEVDRMIFVRGGFCKIVRQLHPKYNEQFELHALRLKPPPNPFATDEEEEPPGSDEFVKGLEGPLALRRMLAAHTRAEQRSSFSTQQSELSVKLPPVSVASTTRSLARSRPRSGFGGDFDQVDETDNSKSQTSPSNVVGSSSSSVLVGVLSAGQTFGVMDMLDGLPYQCSVVPDGWAELYIISKYDLLRLTSKAILLRLVTHYKPRVVDERLVQRLKQMKRWTNYKRELLADIRNRKAPKSNNGGTVDRFAVTSCRVGFSGLHQKDYTRIGAGESIWDNRAQTPPMKAIDSTEEQPTFKVHVERAADGRLDVNVDIEYSDASMIALDQRVRAAKRRQHAAARNCDRQRTASAVVGLGLDGPAAAPSISVVERAEDDSQQDGAGTAGHESRQSATVRRVRLQKLP